ncbi:MAG TPA: metalloregulator ArsR/SmtB family transcription factor [Kineosporiaceae bacterium]|jgi:predicted ArsR family transcriptional regulator|nr:metalloregulator ArsR/SmtB family transcription factor [Kineosporiaceae bacterium]
MPVQEPVTLDPAVLDRAVEAVEDRTRDRVCREILEHGPVSAAQLSGALGLTAAGVRRHLDVLLEQGLVSVHEPSSQQQRPRGRPARSFVLTDAGHAAMATGYDDLATQALRFLSSTGGPDAVRQFAEQRLADVERRYRPVIEAAGPDPVRRAEALATALSHDGFAASTRSLTGEGAAPIGTQLCQGHCPVQHVAREFPELCEAETGTFSRLLGVHVQRLATLAHGEHVCTTHVPHHVPNTRHLAKPQLLTSAAGSTEPSQER